MKVFTFYFVALCALAALVPVGASADESDVWDLVTSGAESFAEGIADASVAVYEEAKEIVKKAEEVVVPPLKVPPVKFLPKAKPQKKTILLKAKRLVPFDKTSDEMKRERLQQIEEIYKRKTIELKDERARGKKSLEREVIDSYVNKYRSGGVDIR